MEERHEIALKAFTSDWFLGSVNAMSEDGVFINIDGNANRIAAYAFGPKNVLLIVGMNKVVKTQEDAMSRARNEAAPVNAQRFGINTPCSKAGSCFNCKSPECICCQILVTRFSRQNGRFRLFSWMSLLVFNGKGCKRSCLWQAFCIQSYLMQNDLNQRNEEDSRFPEGKV